MQIRHFPPADRRFLATTGILVIGAFLLRVYQIDKQELWLDEALSFYTTLGELDIGRILLNEQTPPLYELLLRGWVAMAGTSERSLRLLSALFGTLFIPAVIWTGSVIFNRQVGLWAGGFAAIAPIHIYYSQEARTYTLLVLLLMLSTGLLWRAISLQRFTSWVLVTVTGILALYTHYFAILVLFPMTFMIFIGSHRRELQQNCVRLGAVILLCGVMFLPVLYVHLGHKDQLRTELTWQQRAWEKTPPALAIPRTLEVFGVGSQAGLFTMLIKVYPYVTFPRSLRILSLALLISLGLWVAIPWKDDLLQIPLLQEWKRWLWAMLFFPLSALWLVSFYQPLYAVGRYDLVAFPAYTLLVGLALAKLQSEGKAGPYLALCTAVVLSCLIGTKLVQYYELPPRPIGELPSARATAAALLSNTKNGDVVVFTGLRGLPVLYYLAREGYVWTEENCDNQQVRLRFGCRMFPQDIEKSPGTTKRRFVSLQAVQNDLRVILSQLSEPGGTIWMVFASGTYDGGQLLVPDPDSLLVDELHRVGFDFRSANLKDAAGIFAFSR